MKLGLYLAKFAAIALISGLVGVLYIRELPPDWLWHPAVSMLAVTIATFLLLLAISRGISRRH